MDNINKTKTSLAKFEEFFSTVYTDEVMEVLEKYPEERTLVVDYENLEMFDPDLADLLIEKPDEVIAASQKAIKNIDPLMKDPKLDIKFKNVSNCIDFVNADSKYIGKLISFEAKVMEAKEPKPILDIAVYECRGCMSLREIPQTINSSLEPSLCPECGGRSFRLLQDESEFLESQLLIVSSDDTSKSLKVLLLRDECSFDLYSMGQEVRITGILKSFSSNYGYEYFLECNLIEILNDSEDSEYDEYGNRNSPEYRTWQKVVIDSDRVCQCCGGSKHLEAHHIFSYQNNPSYRVNLENGIALCKWCHSKYHSYYGKDASPKSLIRFLKRFGRYDG